jgi:UDP-N-acetylglucosamine acyltransferase
VSIKVHPLALVEAGASLAPGCKVGPFCHIGSGVTLNENVELVSHVVLAGDTIIGANSRIYPFASLGAPAQDLKSAGGRGALRIGANCLIHEGVTVNLGTPGGGGVTCIGDGCALLAYAHVAHDCTLGDGVVLSNQVLLGGHVCLGDHVMIGGATAVHQYVRIGAHAFVAGLSGVEGDVLPYGLAGGNRAHLYGLNVIGLRRRGFDPDRISRLKTAFAHLFTREGTLAERVNSLIASDQGADPDIGLLISFLRAQSTRPLCAPRARGDLAV